jgi:hypothetical protein
MTLRRFGGTLILGKTLQPVLAHPTRCPPEFPALSRRLGEDVAASSGEIARALGISDSGRRSGSTMTEAPGREQRISWRVKRGRTEGAP